MVGAALLGALVPVPAFADHPAADLKGVFAHVGTIPRFVPDSVLQQRFQSTLAAIDTFTGNAPAGGLPLVSTATGRVYQAYSLKNGRVGVVVRDLRTLGLADQGFLLPPEIASLAQLAGVTQGRSQLPVAVDEANKRMYFWTDKNAAGAYRRGVVILQEADGLGDYKLEWRPLGLVLNDLVPDTDAYTRAVATWEDAYSQALARYADAVSAYLGSLDPQAIASGKPAADPPVPPTPGPPPTPPVTNPSGSQLGDPRLADTGASVAHPSAFQGMEYADGKLYVVLGSSVFQDAPQPTRLLQLDGQPYLPKDRWDNPTTPKANPHYLQVDWDRVVRGCPTVYAEQTGGAPGSMSGFMHVLKTDSSIFLPCTSANNAVVVQIPLDSAADSTGPETTYVGTGVPYGYLVDRAARRIHFRVQAPQGPAVLTFDADQGIYVGLQAIAPSGAFVGSAWALDDRTGRLYTQVPPELGYGLTRLDGRATPVSPALKFEAFPAPPDNGAEPRPKMLARDSVNGRVFVPSPGAGLDRQQFFVLADAPPQPALAPENPDANTADMPEVPGLTGVSYSGGVSGYGMRQLLVGGISGFVPNRITGSQSLGEIYHRPPCQRADREFILAQVKDLRMSNSLVAGQATAGSVDEVTSQDIQSPSRCTEPGTIPNTDPKAYLNTFKGVVPDWALDVVRGAVDSANRTVQGPVDTARQNLDQTAGRAWPMQTIACTPAVPASTTRPSTGTPGDAALAGFEAAVDCTNTRALAASASASPSPPPPDQSSQGPATLPSALASASRGLGSASSVRVASSSSTTSTRLDPQRGTVSRSESLVRGVEVTVPGGSIQIGGIFAMAETAAKGRPGTAHTTYRRMAWGVHAIGPDGAVHCELCATEDQLQQLADGLNRVLGASGKAMIPRVDASLAKGTAGGYQAAIQRDGREVINNTVVNGDSFTEVPALEFLLYNDSLNWGRQRQIFQFAGVKANSQYGIYCLRGHPEDGKCVLPPTAPASLRLELRDASNTPLAGGSFRVHNDLDGNKKLDPGEPQAYSCATDPGGQCRFDGVPPGRYVITETAAPQGYAKAPDASAEVLPGSATTVTFTNVRNVGSVEITLVDDANGQPLGGGSFQLYTDNGDKVLTPADKQYASCTTDASGRCALKTAEGKVGNEVPLGAYVLHQAGAPKGYTTADDVPFALDLPGATARLTITNGAAATAVLSLEEGTPPPEAAVVSQPVSFQPSGGGGGGVLGPLVGELSKGLQWLRRHPGEAVLFAASLGLFAGPFWAGWRRRLLIEVSSSPARR